MTDREKLEAVKAEIECRIKQNTEEFRKSKYPQFTLLGKINEGEHLLTFLNPLLEDDKCKDCNNVKGCITCTNGDQYCHITEY